MTLDEFKAMPIIMSFFPLTFESGIQKWTVFEVRCNSCNRLIAPEQTRGFVDRQVQSNYRTIQTMSYQITAHALCPKCNKLTTANYILHEDMTLEIDVNKTGEEKRWRMRKLTTWQRFTNWLKSFKKREHEQNAYH